MSLGLLIAIYLIGLALLSAEVFIPGGVLGVIGFLMVATSIAVTFVEHGATPGLVMTGVTAVIGYGLLRLSLSRMTLRERQSAEAGYVAVDPGLAKLVGKTGVVETTLRPVGTARIEGRPVTVQSRGDFIEVGRRVKVVEARGPAVIVAPET